MSKLPLGVAKKLLMLLQGEKVPHSQLKNRLIRQMLDEGILQEQLQGRSRKSIFVGNSEVLERFLANNLGINDLGLYVLNFDKGTTRAQNVMVSSDSKSIARRTFKGFLVNCLSPIVASVNGCTLTINPQEGTYTYIHDFEEFLIPKETLIIGVENPENFRFLKQQKHLFNAPSLLFVSRYPQSNDLVNWLQSVPNDYLHFGDFDFEGLRIFRDEYLSYLGARANFFIPQGIELLISKYGNKNLYDKQYRSNGTLNLNDETENLIDLFHNYKKCLEQEVLIGIHKLQ